MFDNDYNFKTNMFCCITKTVESLCEMAKRTINHREKNASPKLIFLPKQNKFDAQKWSGAWPLCFSTFKMPCRGLSQAVIMY